MDNPSLMKAIKLHPHTHTQIHTTASIEHQVHTWKVELHNAVCNQIAGVGVPVLNHCGDGTEKQRFWVPCP